MQSIITVIDILAIFLLSFTFGITFTKVLLPTDIEKEYGTFITPIVGYLAFCLFAFTFSSSFRWATVPTCWGTAAVLASLGLMTQLRPKWRLSPAIFGAQLKQCAILSLPMAIMILFPLFYLGARTYLGAVNPDFFAGVVDNYYLLSGHSVADFKAVKNTYFPIDYMAGTVSVSARFGAGIFGILIQLLTGEETRTSLSLIIGFFLLNIPLILYFFTSVVLGFNKKQATISAWLIGISGPTAMSYLYYYIGQNSGLPVLPLVMASAYLMLVRPSLKTLIFCALLSNALFINYFAMLPYALAPAGVLGLYLLVTRQISIPKALSLIVGFLVVFVLFHLGNVDTILASMKAWGHVIGQTLQGQFFLEFLTELFVPFLFGVVEYPMDNSWIAYFLGETYGKFVILSLTVFVLSFWIWSVVQWARNTKDMARRVFVISALVIYFSVWWYYSFPRQYAYAIFKMSSWLQFMVVPFIVYGFWQLITKKPLSRSTAFKKPFVMAGYLIAFSYVVLNFISTSQYGYNGIGRNTVSGYIVNNFEMSGNRDYFELPKAIAKIVKPNESISVLFVDSIQNYWVSYYLKKFRQSIPVHETMPGDDENLPDVLTNSVMDYYGNLRTAENPLAHQYFDDYILTWNTGHLNRDIVNPNLSAKPIWENHTFRLFDFKNSYDVLVTGRGFYRLEYIKQRPTFWMPNVMRWSSHGGEFYLLHVKNPGKPYRFGFDAVMGYEAPSNSRTLELWLNGKKIQEFKVTDCARFISKPFYPNKGMNKLVLKISDNVGAIKRKLPLWNKDIPNDYRRLNIAFANARVLTPSGNHTMTPVVLNAPLNYIKIFDYADQFDGFQMDGWVGEKAFFVFATPKAVKELQLKGNIDGSLGFKFPFDVQAKINGKDYKRTIDKAGEFTLNFPVASSNREVEVVLIPSQNVIADRINVRHKLIRHSFRIQSMTFVD